MATLQSTKDDEVAASGGKLDNSIINARAVLPIKSCRNLMKFSIYVADDISLEINFRVTVSNYLKVVLPVRS